MRVDRAAAALLAGRRRSRPGIGQEDASREGLGRIALVTGASAGIGESMAKLLSAKGYDVVAVARREGRLRDLQLELEHRWGTRVHPLPCDLGSADAARFIADELYRRGLAIDVLVNNAGYTLAGPYLKLSWEEELRFIQVMALTVAELCRMLVPTMVDQGWGRVINVSSVAGLMAGSPSMVLYSATKAFVLKLTEGLADECEPYGVHCTASVPGGTDTELPTVSQIADWADHHLLLQLAIMRPETVARQAYDACMLGRRVIIHGRHNKAWAFALVHTPPPIRYTLARGLKALEYQRGSTPDPTRLRMGD